MIRSGYMESYNPAKAAAVLEAITSPKNSGEVISNPSESAEYYEVLANPFISPYLGLIDWTVNNMAVPVLEAEVDPNNPIEVDYVAEVVHAANQAHIEQSAPPAVIQNVIAPEGSKPVIADRVIIFLTPQAANAA